jgi:carbon-monoxide dehydrogenase large subunit
VWTNELGGERIVIQTETIPNAVEPRFFGRRMKRLEDPRYLMGYARYIDNITRPKSLYASFTRSTEAHARLANIDVASAVDLDGVVAVMTGADVREKTRPMRADSTMETWQGTEYWALAPDVVRFVGEPVACVVAEDRYVAEDAAQMVRVDYDVLQPVISVHDALAEHAPILHDGWTDNSFIKRHYETEGFEDVMDRCAHRLSLRLEMGRHTGMPLETRGCIAEWDKYARQLTVWSTTQVPHLSRTGLADIIGIPENQVRVISPEMGGGFGIKFPLYPEEIVCALLAIETGRPVKWIEDRREHMLMGNHAREHIHEVEVGFDDSGVVEALRAKILVDSGAYSLWSVTAAMEPGMALGILPGPYKIRNYKVDSSAVATNKTPLGAYRGVARPAACFTIERTIDAVAHSLELDPADVRRRNLVAPDDFPYTSVTLMVYDSGSFIESLDAALEYIGYEDLRERQRQARDDGRYLGIGMAVYTEQTAHTWEEFKKRGIPMTFGYETATVRMDPSGLVTIYVTSHSHGQGQETTFAQIAADELGVDIKDIRIEFGDTSKAVYGHGSFASRSAVLCGGATQRASRVIREKLQRIAAHALETSPDDVEISDGRAFVRGAPERGYSLGEVARWTYHNQQLLPPGEQPVLESTMTYDAAPGTGTFTNAAMAALVEVDPETGFVRIDKLVVVEDCGRMINPLVVDGQVHGGVAQGVGSALLEEFKYDANGQPLVTSFMDYLMPGSTDVPHIEVHHLETPSPFTIHGMKGVGEGGAIGPGALIAGAVEDAIRPLTGAFVNTLPVTPERVLGWIEEGRRDMTRPAVT